MPRFAPVTTAFFSAMLSEDANANARDELESNKSDHCNMRMKAQLVLISQGNKQEQQRYTKISSSLLFFALFSFLRSSRAGIASFFLRALLFVFIDHHLAILSFIVAAPLAIAQLDSHEAESRPIIPVPIAFVMPKQKYYAVAVGKEIGIFEAWEECEKQVRTIEMLCERCRWHVEATTARVFSWFSVAMWLLIYFATPCDGLLNPVTSFSTSRGSLLMLLSGRRKQKFYAVAVGRKRGIFESGDDCKEQVRHEAPFPHH